MSAIEAVGKAAPVRGALTNHELMARPSISVKLSAIHPRFDPGKEERLVRELLPRIVDLAAAARRLRRGAYHRCRGAGPPGPDAWPVCRGVHGSCACGLAGPGPRRAGLRQAGNPRAALAAAAGRARRQAAFRCGWSRAPTGTARSNGRRSAGSPTIPCCTRKLHTDVSYLACLRLLLSDRAAFYPQFATHNAQTIAAVSVAATSTRRLRVPAPAWHGRGRLRGGGRQRQAGRALPHLRARRAARGSRGLSRAASARERRQHVLRQSAGQRGSADRGDHPRSRGRRSRRRRKQPSRQRLLPKPQEMFAPERANSRGHGAGPSPPCARRCWRDIEAELQAHVRGGADRRRQVHGRVEVRPKPVLCPHDRRQRIGTVHVADAASDRSGASRAPPRRRMPGIVSAGRPGPPSWTAPPISTSAIACG